MEAMVRGELEQVEQLALSASRTGERHREEALRAAASHASVALTTLLHVGLITRSEEAEWRERLGGATPERIRRACELGFADRGQEAVRPHDL
jgi:hypothetical protein